MAKWNGRSILWATVVIAALISGIILHDRINSEHSNRQITLAADFQQVEMLAQWSGLNAGEVIDRLREQGINALLVKEETIVELRQKLWLRSGAEALDVFPETFWPQIRSDYTYFFTRDPALAQRIKLQLHYKLSRGAVQELVLDNLQALGIPFQLKELEELGLGFSDEKLELAVQKGMLIVPQLRWWHGAEQSLTAVFASLTPYRQHIAAILFNDKYLPGFPDKIDHLAAALYPLDVPVGLIEFFPQGGIEELALHLNKKAIRVHSISKEEIEKLSPQAALERYELAARERNMRLLITRLKLTPASGDWLQDNLSYLGQLKRVLADAGFTIGRAKPFAPFPFSRLWVFIAGLGVLAAGILLLQQCSMFRPALILGFLGLVFWVGFWGLAAWKGTGGIAGLMLSARQVMALGAAVIFPTLAMLTAWSPNARRLGEGIPVFLRTTTITFLGALIIAAILADTTFFLKINEFKGVKIAFVVPLLLFTAAVIIQAEGRHTLTSLRAWLNSALTAKLILLAAVAAVAGLIYLSRSGNEGVGLLPFEGQLRSFLGNVLLTRPRTKEFLLGYPFLLLSLSLGYRHCYLFLWLLALAGQISLINTFSHLHIPVLISLQRTFNGLWLGLLIGLLLVGFVSMIGKRLKVQNWDSP